MVLDYVLGCVGVLGSWNDFQFPIHLFLSVVIYHRDDLLLLLYCTTSIFFLHTVRKQLHLILHDLML